MFSDIGRRLHVAIVACLESIHLGLSDRRRLRYERLDFEIAAARFQLVEVDAFLRGRRTPEVTAAG